MMMMSFLNKWYVEYTEEVINSLREKENTRIPFFQQSPQFKYRQTLVKWLRYIAEDSCLNNCTVHLAVYLLDIFMDNHRIMEERLNLVALVCISLAAKIEEKDAKVPKLSELNARVCYIYPIADFIRLEFMMMRFLHWNLIHPTVAHFAEYYTLFATSLADMSCVLLQFNKYSDLRYAVQDQIHDFLDTSLLEVSLISVKPSLVASACILAGRKCFQLSPEWPDILQKVTDYQLKDLQPYLSIFISESNVININKKRKLTESPDHGYVTAEDSMSPESSSKKAHM